MAAEGVELLADLDRLAILGFADVLQHEADRAHQPFVAAIDRGAQRLLGTLDMRGSCWSTFYFDGDYPSYVLEEMEGDFRQVTLHVRTSDLPRGEHEKIGTWRKVIVGAPVWERLGL